MKLLRRLFGVWLLWRLFGRTLRPRFAPPQEHPWRLPGRTVFVGDEEFLVREAGPDEGETVLLIHGLGGSSISEWYQVAPKLATQRRVLLVDHRSHGLSPVVNERFEVEDVADDIVGVLDALGIGRVAVVGYSMGGAVAQTIANRHPGRVSKLVLIATFATHPGPMGGLRRIGALITRAWERLTGTGTPEVRTAYLLRMGAVERRHARWLWQETHRRNPEAGAEATLALLRFDCTDWVGRLQVDTLVIIPASDQLVPPRWQYRLAGLIPGARVVEIPDARHEVVWTHPGRVAEAISSFLE
ncbi:MAG: alpha/beta hydrolase [Actinobacteria bacterium]|nr:alpha/beta hydrolase [Actinomycetota bacterium]